MVNDEKSQLKVKYLQFLVIKEDVCTRLLKVTGNNQLSVFLKPPFRLTGALPDLWTPPPPWESIADIIQIAEGILI